MGTQVMGLSGSRALVMGLGVHGGGVGVARYLVGSGARVHVTDMQSPDRLGASIDALSDLPVGYTLGHHDTSDLDGIDFLVRNPGVPREAPFLLEAERRGIPIYMEMTLFFLACPSRRIVAITGTKGKTTTTTLTGEIFRRAGRDTVVAGNLRVSALGQLSRITPTTDVILELSSFQLEGLDAIRTSPRTAAVTNLMVDHLNRYPDMASYMDAKRRIFIYQGSGDVLLLNRDEAYSEAFATTAPGRVEWFNPDDALVGFGDPGSTWGGSHNLANANCAAALARSSGIAEEAIAEAIRGFAGVPYRQEVVRVHRGVRYINDTAATTPDATVAALSSVSGPIVLLLGGADKGLDFTGLVASLADPRSRVTDIVLLEGSATDRLVASVGEGLVRGRHRSFPDAVTQASQLAGSGAAVLLSPGCASFGMFVNEFDRGDQFNALVHALD